MPANLKQARTLHTAGEDRYVWGLAVRDKVPMTQRFLTVTTAMALLSYCVYALLV